MTDFRALHRPGAPLLLPNAWDVASALALAEAGFAAIGTTSLGVAAAAGLPDGQGYGRDETLSLVRALRGRLGVPLTVDIEAGFGGGPAEVADLAADLAEAGAAGINIEDGRPDGTLAEVSAQAELIAAVRARVPTLFINARTDTHWLAAAAPAAPAASVAAVPGPAAPAMAAAVPAPAALPGSAVSGRGELGEAVARGRAYLAAGADGIFVPAVADDEQIRALVGELGGPLNVLLLPGMTVGRLAELGVARVSTGSLLFRAALAAAVAAAEAVGAGGAAPPVALSYARANGLAGRKLP
ncbi:2-methylisocitrate lyase-like PEP mutase family enzyme [Actinoplanes tereljensis]|uniref:Phosphonomutase n=1 Tax=Paractinoplanes tereljensis TaxID=571912 RepID=A0A919TTU5_9ACTN|nr:isocitrate lyase/phosphoenolpyruvate mutase family protein [Actinoplanes tereljensis]GIF20735.1 phosphonomutase [Actinoplanes tereljensis]